MLEVVENGSIIGHAPGNDVNAIVARLEDVAARLERSNSGVLWEVERPGPRRVIVKIYECPALEDLSVQEYEERLRDAVNRDFGTPPLKELSDEEFLEVVAELSQSDRDDYVRLELARRAEDPVRIVEFRLLEGRPWLRLPEREWAEWL